MGDLSIAIDVEVQSSTETPSECEVCNKKFTDSECLAKHKQVHEKNVMAVMNVLSDFNGTQISSGIKEDMTDKNLLPVTSVARHFLRLES